MIYSSQNFAKFCRKRNFAKLENIAKLVTNFKKFIVILRHRVELDRCLFNSSQHWTDTYVTGGFCPHIRLGGFLPVGYP